VIRDMQDGVLVVDEQLRAATAQALSRARPSPRPRHVRVLVLAKKRSAPGELHRQLREGEVEKHYCGPSCSALAQRGRSQPAAAPPLSPRATGRQGVAEGLPSRTIFT